MIIGNGDIAGVLKKADKAKSKDIVFFASGVSNSRETREEEFRREEELLMKQDYMKHLVYFGSLSVFYNDNRYTQHKLKMEKLVKSFFSSYTIIRIGNITWGDNPNTFINYFKKMIKEGKKPELKDEYRYLINEREFLHWINLIPSFNCEMNLTGNMIKVKDIWDMVNVGHVMNTSWKR